MKSQDFKQIENLAEKYRLQAEVYFYELEAKKRSSDALVALSGIIINMTADLRAHEQKHGKTKITERRWELIKELDAISDVFFPLWVKMDNAITVLKAVSREKAELARELAKVKNELETIKKSFDEL